MSTNLFSWARKHESGVEVSSKGEKEYSALKAKLEDGRTIETHYQCCTKGYQPGGKDWRLGKSKPPLDPTVDLWKEYLGLWERWAKLNPALVENLYALAKANNYILKDMFASTAVNQARALATILNKYYNAVEKLTDSP